jgi:hypothetical protein
LVLGAAAAPAPLVSADEGLVSEVVITAPDGVDITLTVAFDAPIDLTDVEAELEPMVGDEGGEVSGDALTIEAPAGEVVQTPMTRAGKTKVHAAARSTYNGTLHCNVEYKFRDVSGEFGTQRACGIRSAPWYFKIDSAWYASAASNVGERGMKWTRNGLTQPMMAPHNEPINYIFHGTFSNTGNDDWIWYNDFLSWRHNMGQAGGTITLEIGGSLHYIGPV